MNVFEQEGSCAGRLRGCLGPRDPVPKLNEIIPNTRERGQSHAWMKLEVWHIFDPLYSISK